MSGPQVRLSVGWIAETDLAYYLAAADLAVFPFTAVDNSGSVLLALGAGLPVVVPDIPEFASLPDGATVRFANTDTGLSEALEYVQDLGRHSLEAMADCAARFGREQSWPLIASTTRAAYQAAIDGVRVQSTLTPTIEAVP